MDENKPLLGLNGILWLFFGFSALYVFFIPVINFPLKTLLKIIPMLILVSLVVKSDVSKSTRKLLLMGLLFSLMGDIVLTLPLANTLVLGIVFFLLAHIAYMTLFVKGVKHVDKSIVLFIPILLLALYFYKFILPFVGNLTIPISIYVFILTSMVFTAFLNFNQAKFIVLGAVLFMSSDLILALNEFVYPSMQMRISIMITYYLAQFFIVLGVLSRSPQLTVFMP